MPPTTPSASSPSIRAALAAASELHRAGRLAEAGDAYRALATADPNFLPAIHGLALVTSDLGYPARAMPLMARCVAAEPDNLAYRCGFGVIALALDKPDAAATALLPAANASPMHPEPRLLLARALGALGRWEEAHAVMAQTTAVFPDRAELWAWQGRCAQAQGDLDAARTAWLHAAQLAPNDPDIMNNLGVLLRSCGRNNEAAAAYRAALAHAPESAVIHSNLGNTLDLMGEETQAEIHLRRALTLDPDFIDGNYNLGAHLVRLHQPEAAIPYLRRVVTAQPQRWDALTNLGVALVACGELAEAEACYRAALALKPGNPEAHYDLAWLLLLSGRWAEGWTEYEWRWEMPSFSSRRRTFAAPLWDGTPIPGTLLMHAEQGMGDGIQFVRYAKLAAERCGRLVIQAPPALAALFTHAIGAGLIPGDVVTDAADVSDVAAHIPFMSLPRVFATTPATIPGFPHYLAAPKPRAALTLPARGRRRIGVVWAGSPDNRIDTARSMPATLLAPLCDATDADFVSLQVGPGAAETAGLPAGRVVFACESNVRDFADTAAVIDQLDLIIGVDTAVIHLAGALGKPVWLLLSAAPDYRWLAEGATTGWYPSIRLFRQAKRGDWASVIASVAKVLTGW